MCDWELRNKHFFNHNHAKVTCATFHKASGVPLVRPYVPLCAPYVPAPYVPPVCPLCVTLVSIARLFCVPASDSPYRACLCGHEQRGVRLAPDANF